MPPGFKYACFISYKHPPKGAPKRHFWKSFAEGVCEKLNEYMTSGIHAYVDSQADPGSSYPTELSQALCSSVCMVAILVNQYPDSNWCMAEWEAMAQLEEKRLGKGKVGLIIPVTLQGDVMQWENLTKRRPVDFSNIWVKSQLGNVGETRKFQQIAAIIDNWVERVSDTCENCDAFQIAVPGEVLTYPPRFAPPDPLRQPS
ncbi:MAG TPA: toll/interleukin-1 receptor domain-containing protein [Pyrinomonadaceae bacterium]|nr:toll/interleukin-1 receptor domain-containing protein [Pyrinomonadaceae bacterium]